MLTALDLFPKAKRAKDGRDTRCKKCAAANTAKYRGSNIEKCRAESRAYVAANKEANSARALAWNRAHPDIANARNRAWREANLDAAHAVEKQSREKHRDAYLLRKKQWASENKHLYAHYATKRRAALLNATPLWADLNAIKKIYEECSRITLVTGVEHHVDHIVPLLGTNVRGLHVESNLRIISGAENRSKSNRFDIEAAA
jgi:hypothetical protein